MTIPHVAAGETVSEKAPGQTYQPCAFCAAALVSVPTGRGQVLTLYAVGECVGDGCSRKRG